MCRIIVSAGMDRAVTDTAPFLFFVFFVSSAEVSLFPQIEGLCVQMVFVRSHGSYKRCGAEFKQETLSDGRMIVCEVKA